MRTEIYKLYDTLTGNKRPPGSIKSTLVRRDFLFNVDDARWLAKRAGVPSDQIHLTDSAKQICSLILAHQEELHA